MKKLLLSLTVVAFAVAAQAGDNKATCKDSAKGGCCSKSADTVKTSTETKGGCCSAKQTASKGKVSKPLMSPKAAELASK